MSEQTTLRDRPSAAPTAPARASGTRIGRHVKPIVAGYELFGVLGAGGMGVVWEAFEHRFERRVALKVHAQEHGETHDDLWSEAFVAAKIGDPGIVRVLDVGYTLDDRPYYAMELVEGTDLAAVIADGKLPARRAVTLAADVARAAAAAHEHGVIHRDLKPRNVIVDKSERARVVDFGIAVVAKNGPDPLEGQLAGSPAYMAPEQALGLPIVPQTDIFAIGVMLFEMLTGERPFKGDTVEQVLGAIVSEPAPRLRDKAPSIHEDLEAIVSRCLAKAAKERFSSARVLFETLSAVLEGRAIEPERKTTYAPKACAARAPSDRPRREDAKKHFVWSWRLRASPSALWPYVADTDRFNKAVGAGPVVFEDAPLPQGGVERTGEQRVLGMAIRWREFPFEWIKDREHSVFRWYRSGPIAAMWNRVSLAPLGDSGTELTHEVWITPRGVVGQVAAYVEVDRKLAPAFDRFYRHLDEVLAERGGDDPFEAPHEPSADARATVEAVARRLVGEGFDARLVERLARHVLTAPDGVVRTLRPYDLAVAWGFERAQVLDVFVHAAHEGLLEPSWDVVCPKCNLAHESHKSLAGVRRVGTCNACASTFERDLKDCVELVFAPHPSLRVADRETYCLGAPARRPHIAMQQLLEPGEERTVEIELPRGHFRVTGAMAHVAWDFVASAVGFETSCEVAGDAHRVVGRPDIVRAGRVSFSLRNQSEHEETFRIEIPGARIDGVTASTALTHPSFRALFSDQLLAQGEHLRVSQLAFLFTSLQSGEACYQKLGDAAACELVTRLEDIVRGVARAHQGTLVPSSLDLLVVAFPTPLRAARAALELLARVESAALPGAVAVAAHDGRCIALTRGDTAEFFGETLHRGHALLGDCPPGGLTLSASFAADRGVAVALHEAGFHDTVTTSPSGPYAGRRVVRLTREP